MVAGDTIKVVSRGFETPVRLIGIDTPETRHPSKPVQCFGPAASACVPRLLQVGERVRLVTHETQDTRDRYGRLLAYVYKPGRSGAQSSINLSLVRSGHAKVYVYGGVRFGHATAFFQAQNRVRKAKSGLWGPRAGATPRRPIQRTPLQARRRRLPSSRRSRPATRFRGPCDPNYAGACIPVYAPDVHCTEIPIATSGWSGRMYTAST